MAQKKSCGQQKQQQQRGNIKKESVRGNSWDDFLEGRKPLFFLDRKERKRENKAAFSSVLILSLPEEKLESRELETDRGPEWRKKDFFFPERETERRSVCECALYFCAPLSQSSERCMRVSGGWERISSELIARLLCAID